LKDNQEKSNEVVVVQNNDLVSACYRLNLNPKRLLLIAIGKLDSAGDDWKYQPEPLRIHRDEWCKAYNIDRRNGTKTLRDSAKELYEANIRIGTFRKGAEFRFISRYDFDDDGGFISVTFTPEMLRFSTGLYRDFTKFALLNVKAMKSNYAIRLYELSKQFSKIGRRTIEIDDIREMLGVEPGQYEKFGEFNKWVLQRAAKEASLKGDLDITVETVRRGRKVTAITLVVKEKQQGQFVF
jgi:plasmid replication initiation protein